MSICQRYSFSQVPWAGFQGLLATDLRSLSSIMLHEMFVAKCHTINMLCRVKNSKGYKQIIDDSMKD